MKRLTFEERSNAVIYVSDQIHASVVKGLLIIGFRREQIHTVAADDLFRMDISKLQAAVKNDMEEGAKPFAVFAQVFTTELRRKKVLRMCTIQPETTKQDIYDTMKKLMAK